MLRNSSIFRDNIDKFHDEEFLLGDSAYPLMTWLVTPYKDYGNLTRTQKRYNKLHSSARVVIEREFGQLKGRFRRLIKFDALDFKLLCHIILAACVMHNLCVRNHDEPIGELDEPEDLMLPYPDHTTTWEEGSRGEEN